MKMNTERLEKDFETLKQAIKDRLPEIDLEELKYNIQSGIQNIPQNLADAHVLYCSKHKVNSAPRKRGVCSEEDSHNIYNNINNNIINNTVSNKHIEKPETEIL